jgi:hypothetical protein
MRDQTDSRTLPLPLPQRAMTNAERQRAWRQRNAGKLAAPREASVTDEVLVAEVEAEHKAAWVAMLAAGKLGPYQQHVFKCRYGVELWHQVRGVTHA